MIRFRFVGDSRMREHREDPSPPLCNLRNLRMVFQGSLTGQRPVPPDRSGEGSLLMSVGASERRIALALKRRLRQVVSWTTPNLWHLRILLALSNWLDPFCQRF
jgi:hypothetical protein